MKIAFYTLGCKLNQSETYSMANQLKDAGHNVVDLKENPDVCIINTCTVTSHSDQRCRQMIRRFIKTNPLSSIIVTGCYAQREPEKVKSIPGVAKVIGNIEKGEILKYLQEIEDKKKYKAIEVEEIDKQIYSGVCGEFGKTRAFIKIQDGCNSNCSYCIVPKVRGRNRSVPVEVIIENVKKAVAFGYPEIVITGIHIGIYGDDNSAIPNLAGLMKEILKDIGSSRIRLSSIEPEELSDELLALIINNENICKHLHIPLQSGSDKILKMMNRRYSAEKYLNIIKKVVDKYKNIALGTDLIVGFPGETEEDFKETVEFVKKIPFSYMHVFPYSKRMGTKAADLNDTVSNEEKKERVNIIRDIASGKKNDYIKCLIGKVQNIVIETTRHKKTEKLVGLTDNYLKVLIDGSNNLMKNKVKVKMVELKNNELFGKLI